VTRAAEPGEVVTAGTAVVTLLDLTKVYLRGFVPEGEIGKVKVGQAARVYLDSDPRKPVDAYVSRIDPRRPSLRKTRTSVMTASSKWSA